MKTTIEPIKDLEGYTTKMAKSMLDKLWWINKVDVTAVVDYGCADGSMLKEVKRILPNVKLYGVDINVDMLEIARQNVPGATFVTPEEYEQIDIDVSSSVIVASSMLHEIMNYSDNIHKDMANIFLKGYKYVAIRDMFISKESERAAVEEDVANVRVKYSPTLLADFEYHCGDIAQNRNLVQFFLTYKYTANWDREVRENYFPYTIEEFLGTYIPALYDITYFHHYTLQYIKQIVWQDFGVQLKDKTHAQILLEYKGER